MRIQEYSIGMQANSFAFKENFLGTQASLSTSENTFTNSKATAIIMPKKIGAQKAQTDPVVVGKIADEALKLIAKIRENKSVDASELLVNSQNLTALFNDVNERVNFVINSARTQLSNFVQVEREHEALSFSTQGIVKADGKEIKLDLNFNLSRSFTQVVRMSHEVTFFDPLVISFDGKMPTISDSSFSFDIDADGEVDQISRLGAGSGFLALDKNGNAKIDDGSELFGTKSGDGFADLAKYDDDKNGWIDENDQIFKKLRIWQNFNDGQRLVGLGEVGIGAIFLGSAKGEFSFNTLETNESLAKLKSSGFFLYENGKSGFIAQIDMAKRTIISEQNTSIKLPNIASSPSFENGSVKIKEKDDENLLDKLRKRLSALISKLASADKKQAKTIQMQINQISMQIFSLMTTKIY
ncbi:hypothetical protein U5B43_05645 [Campylobacter sp. 9BO]|uniref:hypothetical protein n=1 Tax=Campylobacter sp. 9BO TaxID=3424759 RepID=UPI003D337F31